MLSPTTNKTIATAQEVCIKVKLDFLEKNLYKIHHVNLCDRERVDTIERPIKNEAPSEVTFIGNVLHTSEGVHAVESAGLVEISAFRGKRL